MKPAKIELGELLKDHQDYMDVLQQFCRSDSVDRELNSAYLQITKKLAHLAQHGLSFYKPFKGDLYTAESEWTETNHQLMRDGAMTAYLSWETLKPFLYDTHSKISNLLGVEVVNIKKVLKKRNTAKSTEHIVVGPLAYGDGVLYFNGSIIKGLAPQAVEICKLFLNNPNQFISYGTIQDEVSKNTHLSKSNMQKLISKLRTVLKSKTKKNLIELVENQGYSFDGKILL